MEQDILSLRAAGIELHFLFDGALPDDKRETRLKRCRAYIERAEMVFTNLDKINAGLKEDTDGTLQGIQYSNDLYLIPPLMLEVCLQTLRQLGYEPITCCREADGLVVRMAEEHQGYIVSKDSDMHVYPHAGKGYIPLDNLNIVSQENGTKRISAMVYIPQKLASLLGIEVQMLPIFGALMGNDYLDASFIKLPIMSWCTSQGFHCKTKGSSWPKYVAEFVRKISALSSRTSHDILDIIKDELEPHFLPEKSRTESASKLKMSLVESIRRYDPESTLLQRLEVAHQSVKSRISNLRMLSRAVMDVVETKIFWTTIFLEDLEQASSWNISRRIRQCMYTILLSDNEHPPSVAEYAREKRHLTELAVEGLPLNEIRQLVPSEATANLSIASILNDRSACRSLFESIHNTSNEKARLAVRRLNSDAQYLVFCLRYMIHNSAQPADHDLETVRLKNHEIVGLIIGSIASMASRLGYANQKWPMQDGKPALKKRTLHLTAQFQSTLLCSHLLGQVLDIEYPKRPQLLLSTYDGLQMHRYLQAARRGASIGSMLDGSVDQCKTLFLHVYRAVMIGMDDMVDSVYHYDIPMTETGGRRGEWLMRKNLKKRRHNGESHSTKRPSLKKRVTDVQTPSSSNPFDVLSFGCNFDG